MFTLAVNPNTNQVTSGGAVYDGAGNMTQNGNGTASTFDEMNRMTSSEFENNVTEYTYSPGENKRMVTFVNYPEAGGTATLYLYGPDGRTLSVVPFQKSGSNWVIAAGGPTNYLYLGGKVLNYAENNIGSTTTATTFWPYGQTNTGSGGVFGTYLGDSSGFLYADQRYYNQTWGRFVTADPSNANIDPTVSGSFNRYAYVSGDPINGMDPKGLDNQYCFDDGYGPECFIFSDGDMINPGEFDVVYDQDGNIQSITNIKNQESVTVNGDDPDPVPTDPSDLITAINNPNEITSPLNNWPWNGNWLPLTPQEQDGVCSTGWLSGPMNSNPAVLACCQAHDKCYTAHGCNYTSWPPNPLLPWSTCKECNATVMACITRAVTGH
jgi:RHS repeat-associated protein